MAKSFIRGLLDDPEDPQLPQYNAQGGWDTAANFGRMAAGMTTPGAVADAAGLLGGPSIRQNVSGGNYLDALLQGVGVIPGVGMLAKAGAGAKMAMAIPAATKSGLGRFVSQSLGHDIRPVGRAADPGKAKEIGISGRVLERPIGEMTRDISYDIQPEHSVLTPEELGDINAVMFGLPGDRADGGGTLTAINGKPLDRPVELQAGSSFTQGKAARGPDKAAWASDLPVMTKLASRVRRAADEGFTPVGGYNAMGPTSVDYSHHVSDVFLDRLRQNVPNNDPIKRFDKAMREGSKDHDPYADWPGLLSPNIESYLYGGGTAKSRTKMAELADKGFFRKAGFPDMAEVRFGVTNPALLHSNNYDTGHSIVHLDPTGRIIKDPVIPHKTYNTQIGAGDRGYMGGFEYDVPFDVMYKDWIANKITENPKVYADPHRGRSSLMMAFRAQPPSITFNPQTVDRLSKYMEDRRRGLIAPLGLISQ